MEYIMTKVGDISPRLQTEEYLAPRGVVNLIFHKLKGPWVLVLYLSYLAISLESLICYTG